MNDISSFFSLPPAALFVFFLWSVLWKGLALWNSARNTQRNWFVVLLVVNTVGILEIIYLFFFAKKKMKLTDLKFWK